MPDSPDHSEMPAFLAGVLTLGPDQLRRSVGFEELVQPVAEALAAFSTGLGEAPVSVFAPKGAEGDVHVKSAWLPNHQIFTVKVASWFAARIAAGLTPSSGLIAAFDADRGELRALLCDDHHLSDVRTAAAGAVAARHLARPNSRVLGVLGTGVQAYLQALAAAHVLPALETVRVWGRTPSRADRIRSAIMRRRPDLNVQVAADPAEAVRSADILVTATSARAPFVADDWIRPGLHITAVGADDATKCELAPAVIARADRLVVDSRALSLRYGDISRAVGAGAIPEQAHLTELGEIVAGRADGRQRPHEITIAKLIGLGVQDLVAVEAALGFDPQRQNRPVPPSSVLDLAPGA